MNTTLEIHAVANGYYVIPKTPYSDTIPHSTIYVFESFHKLADWLKLNLKTPETFLTSTETKTSIKS